MGIGQPGTAATDRVGDRHDGVVLPDDPLVEQLLEMHQLRGLRLHQPVERDAGGLGDDLGDVLGVDLLLEHRLARLQHGEVAGGLFDAALQFGNASVPDLGGRREVGFALDLGPQVFELLLE